MSVKGCAASFFNTSNGIVAISAPIRADSRTCSGFLTLATYFRFFSDLAIELLGIILMPLGWFGVWEGFSKIVDTSPIFIQEEILFNKLSKGQFKFIYIEPHKVPAQENKE